MRDAAAIDKDRQRAVMEVAHQKAEHEKTLQLLEQWMARSAIPVGRTVAGRCRLCDEPDTQVNIVFWRKQCPHHATQARIDDVRATLKATVLELSRVFTETDPASLTD